MGKLTIVVDFIALSRLEIKSPTCQAHITRREAKRRINNHQCSESLPTDQCSSFAGLGYTLNIVIKVILICFICLNMSINIMMLALKSGPQIAAKTGNPAGLLFRRIWYSVGESGVLGITEYRQGRPLIGNV